MIRAVAIGAALSLAIHVILGWAWTLLAGLVAGFFAKRLHGLAGGLAVGLAWSMLIVYSFAVAGAPTGRMITVTGYIFGGLPSVLVLVATLLIGVILGTAGGLLSTPVLHFWNRARL